MTNKQWISDLEPIDIAEKLNYLMQVGDMEPNDQMEMIIKLIKDTYRRYHYQLLEKAFDSYLIGGMPEIHKPKKINSVFVGSILNRFIKDVKVPKYNPFERQKVEVVMTEEEIYQQGIRTLKILKADFVKAYWEKTTMANLNLTLLKIGYDFVIKHNMYEPNMSGYDQMYQWITDYDKRKTERLKKDIENENKTRNIQTMMEILSQTEVGMETLDKAVKMALILKDKTNENRH